MNRCIWGLLISAVALSTNATAQTFPSQAVKIIVPSSAGGAIDLSARIVADALAAKWQKPVVIENRPGAAMRTGAEAAARAAPDGYTLFVAHDGTMAMNPVVYPELRYDPVKDFEPIGLLATAPYVLMIHKQVEAKDVPQLISLAKKKPGGLNNATGGTATLLALELFKAMADVDIASIPFRGSAPSINALMGGQVDMTIQDVGSAQAAMRSEYVRLLAVTSLKRMKEHPNIPTLDEAGVKGYEDETWFGMFAPKGTPEGVLTKTRTDVREVLSQPGVRERFEKANMAVPTSNAVADMGNMLTRNIAKWGKLIAERKIKIVE